MDKQALEARKAQLQADRETNTQEIQKLQQAIAQRQALDHTLNGAMQDVDHWLKALTPSPLANLPDPAPRNTGRGSRRLIKTQKKKEK